MPLSMYSLSENITRILIEIIEKGILTVEQLEKRIINCIKELSENESLHVLECFSSADLTSVEDKENFLYESFLDHVKSNKKTESFLIYLKTDIKDISDSQKVLKLLERTRYTLTISTGQRRYGGPPPHWDGPPPGTGDVKFFSQVHIGKLGPKIFEDTLVPILETCGRIYQLRIMINSPTGENKGYAFADFFTNEEAEKFVETYNGKTIEGETTPITAKLTVPNCKLFVGGFPTNRSKEDVEKEFKKIFDNSSIEVKAFTGSNNRRRNRGYAFVTFPTHNEASKARKKLEKGKVKVFNHVVSDVEWAEGDEMPDEQDIKPKVIYIRFGSATVDESILKDLFKDFGEIKSIDIFTEYAFVEFVNEENATKALSVNGHKIGEVPLIISNARVKKAKSVKKIKSERKMKHLGREWGQKNRPIHDMREFRERNRQNQDNYPLDFYPSRERFSRTSQYRDFQPYGHHPSFNQQTNEYSYEVGRRIYSQNYNLNEDQFPFDANYGNPSLYPSRRDDSYHARREEIAHRGSSWDSHPPPASIMPNFSLPQRPLHDRPRYPLLTQVHRQPIPQGQESLPASFPYNRSRQAPQTAFDQPYKSPQPVSHYPSSVDKVRHLTIGNVDQSSTQHKPVTYNPNYRDRSSYIEKSDINQSFMPNQPGSYFPNQDQPRYSNPSTFGHSFEQSSNTFRPSVDDPRGSIDGPYSNINMPNPASEIRYW